MSCVRRIFDGPEIALDVVDGEGSSVVVSFTSYERSGGAVSGAFSGAVSRSKMPGLFFISKKNHWFNSMDLEAAIAAANAFLSPWTNRVAIGASMGAHAAIRLSNRLDISVSVAVSPQFCIRDDLVPFEGRWRTEAASIRQWDGRIGSFGKQSRSYIAFDPNDIGDKKHAHMIARAVDARLIPMPDSGHSSARAIADLGMLPDLLKFAGAYSADDAIAENIEKRWNTERHRVATAIINNIRKGIHVDVPPDVIGGSSSIFELQRVLKSKS